MNTEKLNNSDEKWHRVTELLEDINNCIAELDKLGQTIRDYENMEFKISEIKYDDRSDEYVVKFDEIKARVAKLTDGGAV